MGCRVQVLSDVLPGPPLLARSVDIRVENHVQVQPQQTLLDIDSHAVGNPALEPGAPRIGWLERYLHLCLDSRFHSKYPLGMPREKENTVASWNAN